MPGLVEPARPLITASAISSTTARSSQLSGFHELDRTLDSAIYLTRIAPHRVRLRQTESRPDTTEGRIADHSADRFVTALDTAFVTAFVTTPALVGDVTNLIGAGQRCDRWSRRNAKHRFREPRRSESGTRWPWIANAAGACPCGKKALGCVSENTPKRGNLCVRPFREGAACRRE